MSPCIAEIELVDKKNYVNMFYVTLRWMDRYGRQSLCYKLMQVHQLNKAKLLLCHIQNELVLGIWIKHWTLGRAWVNVDGLLD